MHGWPELPGSAGAGHTCRRAPVALTMTNINGVLARVFVSGLDAAVPLYQELAGVADVSHFAFRDVQLAQVGPFLLLAGNTAAYRDRVATILVEQLGPVITAIENAGGQIVEGPSTAPNGARLIARHPDDSVFEYIENGRRPTADRGT
jgi:hypothetical protein